MVGVSFEADPASGSQNVVLATHFYARCATGVCVVNLIGTL